MADLRAVIEDAWHRRGASRAETSKELEGAVDAVINGLDSGDLRVAELIDGTWTVNEWVKKAILLYLATNPMVGSSAGPFEYVDRVPLKTGLAGTGVRAVPGAIVRRGAFIEAGAVLMPSFVNIGARVGSGTLVDTWATVGSCAQVGRNVHLSGGVGLGGVLEPPQGAPVIVEDDAFIGSRSMITEGARIGTGAMLGAGVILNPSIPVIDAESGAELSRGVVPPWCLVVNATRPRQFSGGTFGLPCALVIKRFEPGERHDKAALNDLLRSHGVAT